ncbi:MAG: dethiobiotin synthase [Mariprofundaceae bacterium]
MGRKIFITATDTGAGKTFVASHLIKLLLDQGINASAIKPIACGTTVTGINEDVERLLKAQSITDPNQLNLHTFSQPVSPNIAATAEGKNIDSGQLISWCNQQAENSDFCLVEGVGGLMVPLNDRYLVSHWIADMKDCEVMLIIGARLGSINHALLTLKQLERLKIIPRYLVINALGDDDFPKHLVASLRPFISPETLVSTIPYNAKQEHFQLLINSLLTNQHNS